ncbi:hypothetical protein [Aquabacter spiritensis]|uniref:Uncharacterized protein n=1 Tax=Aquabacter spiritensis TaxID=933073 RepID=A0A4R3M013_9HYPH|nr:hypothetical protein [Aquabacter spiritensis]TCT04397.1 hypothetical protein EDC64_107215 [Aquabacter spiritensis]
MRKIAVRPALAALAVLVAGPAFATDYASMLTPAKPGWPLAHPIAAGAIAPPPFSLPSERGVKPAYVPGLPGLPQARAVTDDFGRKPLKYDAVFIRQSKVENGEVVIPPGGLAYLQDTWGGEVALRGEQVPVLGRLPTFVDYDMTIEVKENVTIPAGGAVVVGGQVYHYYATVGHQKMANHSLHVRTIAGTDWEWAFGAPELSATETGWWGNRFAQLYNQGQAREISPKQLTFDWLSGVRMDRVLYAEDTVFAGLAASGETWKVGERSVHVAGIDEAAGTVTLEVRANGVATASKVLGPVQADRLIEDTTARKALVFEDGDMVAILSPWPKPFEGGKANIKVYAKAFSLAYGTDFARDPRFAVYPVGCPTGHNFGFMLVNKEEIRLTPGSRFEGPEGYFRIVVDAVDAGAVTGWHVEDAKGNRSINLGGPQVANVDLVLGQGRVAGQAILKDVGRALLARTYETAARLETAALPAGAGPAAAPPPAPASSAAPSAAATPPAQAHAAEAGFSPGLILAVGIMAVGAGAVGFEVGRRRKA